MGKKVCSRCINDETVLNIKFNEESVCNFCLEYEGIEKILRDKDYIEMIWKKRIDRVRGKFKYDAVVGISGGKDSMYVLYKLVKVYNLKVKAFTMDNGFLSSEAKERIDILIKEFNVEHEYIFFEKEDMKKVYRLSLKKTFAPCSGCSYVGYTQMIKFAAINEAPLIIHGRSTMQMFRALRKNSKDPFMPLLMAGLKDIDTIDLKSVYDEALFKANKVLGDELFEYLKEAVECMNERGIECEFLAYFLYHEYLEDEVFKVLEENTSWKVPKNKNRSHFDCEIHKACAYLYELVELRPHIMPEISVMIRQGDISREEGFKLLEKEKLYKEPEESMDKFFNFIELNKNKTILKHKLIGKVRRVIKK